MRVFSLILMTFLLSSCVIDRVIVLFGDSLFELSTETIIRHLREGEDGKTFRQKCDGDVCEFSRVLVLPQAVSGSPLHYADWPEYIGDTLDLLSSPPSHIFMSWGTNDISLPNLQEKASTFDYVSHLGNMLSVIDPSTKVYFLLPHDRIREINPYLYDVVISQIQGVELFCMESDQEYYDDDNVHFSPLGEQRLAQKIEAIIYDGEIDYSCPAS